MTESDEELERRVHAAAARYITRLLIRRALEQALKELDEEEK